MKVLITDPDDKGGCGALDVAIRMRAHGHDVKLHMRRSKKNEFVGKGLIDCVDDFYKWASWADLIFNCDISHYLDTMDKLRAEGKAVISAGKEAAKWEMDREYGIKVLEKCGIEVPPYKMFDNYDAAIAYVKKEDRKFVSKPNGNLSKALSYCSKSPADMVYMLERWKKGDKLKESFLLQEFKKGTEMAVGGWFGPGGFNSGWCENWEFKKLMNGDCGVATGEMGTVVRYTVDSKLAKMVLEPVGKYLEQENYVGHIDVNCIIDEDGNPWPLEFTMRPGWPTYNIQQRLHKGDPAEWLYALAKGEDLKVFDCQNIAIGVLMAIPDFPYSHATQKEVVGIPVYNITKSMWPNVHPCEMMMGQAPVEVNGQIVNSLMPCTAGDYVLIVTALGSTVVEAREKVYRRVDRIEIPNSPMYRTDIGVRLRTQLLELQANGFAKRMKYR